jgi:hypothetical protein
MPIKFTLGGVTVERRKLTELPSFLAVRAQAALEARASTVAASIAAAYPVVSGGLQSGVIVRSQPRKTKARVLIVHKLRRALAYEKGTKPRYTKKHKKKAYRGQVPRVEPGRNFIPKIMQARIDLVPRIAAIMRAEGLTVSGG